MPTKIVVVLVLALLTLASFARGETKCRNRDKILYLNDVCPVGYTDITGQEYGENFGIKPVPTPQERQAAEKKRLENWIRERQGKSNQQENQNQRAGALR